MTNYDPMPGWADVENAMCGHCFCEVCECTPESMIRWLANELVGELRKYDPALADGYADALYIWQIPDDGSDGVPVVVGCCPSEQCSCADCLPF